MKQLSHCELKKCDRKLNIEFKEPNARNGKEPSGLAMFVCQGPSGKDYHID